MPFTPTAATGILFGSIISAGNIGTGVMKLATGVAFGTDAWLHTVNVTTIDTGTVGAGVGVIPFLVPQPLLLGTLTAGFADQNILGISAPLLILGLANGLSLALATGLITTTHPSVGTGTGVVTFSAGPATQAMIAGFNAQGMNTPVSQKLAIAISQGLNSALSSFVTVTPIAGASGPVASSGTGSGTII